MNSVALGQSPKDPRSPDAKRLRVLCVDDEPNVLAGLRLHLERPYQLSTATSGAQALAILESEGPCAIVISDMRMPEMDGATFLARVKDCYPDSVRILLTGHADMKAAVAAVNEGQIFRFLMKPCPLFQLLGAVGAAADQYRLITAERVLLEQTLHGSVKTLTDVLALTHPLAFGRAMRLRQAAAEFAAMVKLEDRWQLEIAAMLSQIGCVTLPAATVEKLHYGQDLSEKENWQIVELPFVAARLLSNIPRLETVCAILTGSGGGSPSPLVLDTPVKKAAQMFRIVSDYDALESRQLQPAEALDVMRGRGDRYDTVLLAAFADLRGGASVRQTTKEVPLHALTTGMLLAEDIRLESGLVLAARGYEVTPQFVERAKNFQRTAVNKSVRVILRR